MRTPAPCEAPAPRTMPATRPPLEDPDRFEGRDVSANGGSRWHRQGVNVSHVCIGDYGGLEDIDEGIWKVSFGALNLGRFLARPRRIAEADGRLKRRR
jgi:putative transposase